MNINDLTLQFSDSRPHQIKAIFASLFILQNRLQTAFDQGNPEITLKQFMLLIIIRQAAERNEFPTFTQAGKLLGCSRQNIKKLAVLLEKKGWVQISTNAQDVRASTILPTEAAKQFFAGVAAEHEQMLNLLFSSYTNEQIHLFFEMLTMLYPAIDKLETAIQKENFHE